MAAAVEAVSGGGAGQELLALSTRSTELAQERAALRAALAGEAAAAYHAASQALGAGSTGLPVPSGAPALLAELRELQLAEAQLLQVQGLQLATRHRERAVRAVEKAHADGDAAALLRAVSEAVQAGVGGGAGSTSIPGAAAAAEGSVLGRLQGHAARLRGRASQAQATLRALLGEAVQARLAALHWPPPLSLTSAAAGAAPAWATLEEGCEAAAELRGLLSALLSLQLAVQPDSFEAPADSGDTQPLAELPVLWVAEELARPVAHWLAHHFAGGLPTDRPDRPEWLFAAALAAVRQCAPPASSALQPLADAQGLRGRCAVGIDLARAVAGAVADLLRTHLLPMLCAAGDRALWLHLADEAVTFERRLAPLRGCAAMPGSIDDDEEDPAGAAHAASLLGVLLERPEWRDAWLGAELADAERQLEAAVDAPGAWKRAQHGLAGSQLGGGPGDDEDDALATPHGALNSGQAAAAWRQEFWPPACAEQAVSLVGSLCRCCAWLPTPEQREDYMQAVPLAVLRTLRARLTSLLATAEQFRDPLGPAWLPRVGAAICAAHYVEHSLREPQGPLLLLQLESEEGCPAAASLAARVDKAAAGFASLRKQWSYRLARAAVESFQQRFATYRRDLSPFSAGYDPERPEALISAPPPPPAPCASRTLLVAADALAGTLRALGASLDAVAFRDVWRAVALAVNAAAYNEVATEALFSPQGACQLEADLAALVGVFVEYTPRPATHLREAREAGRLLLLPRADALALLSALHSAGTAAADALRAAGVRSLNAEQAVCVLAQRLDLPGRAVTPAPQQV